MKKIKPFVMFSLLICLPLQVTAAKKNVETINVNNAVEISIGSIGPGVDQAALKTIKQVIGAAVANGVIDKYVIYHGKVPIEGGFTACAQAAPLTKAFPKFVQQLKTIKPNPNTSFYSLKNVPVCLEPVCNEDNCEIPLEVEPPVGVCTQDVKICPDGSGVGRVPPSCEFAPCPGDQVTLPD